MFVVGHTKHLLSARHVKNCYSQQVPVCRSQQVPVCRGLFCVGESSAAFIIFFAWRFVRIRVPPRMTKLRCGNRRPHVRHRETHRKARRVGPPSAVNSSRDSILFKKPRTERPIARRGTSAHQARSTLAETPPCSKVCTERPIARRGTSAHQARSPAQNAQQRESHCKARHVGPPSEVNSS